MANPSGGMRLKVMCPWRGIPTPRYYPEEREPWPLNRLERGHHFTEEWGAVQRMRSQQKLLIDLAWN